MTVRARAYAGGGLHIPGALVGFVAVCVASASAILALAAIGPVALVIPALGLLVVLAAAFPRLFAYLMLGAMIVFEQGTFDYTKDISATMWELPGGLKALIPITVSPMEIALLSAALSLFVRSRKQVSTARVPMVAWAVPVVIFLGIGYGLRGGADSGIAYNEARGLLFGIVVFAMALRMDDEPWSRALKVVMVASTFLAINTILRWAFYTRGGESPVPIEFAFAHENAVFFGIAIVIAGLGMVRAESNGARFLWLLQVVLLLAATLVTGRRAGTLVLLVGGATVAWLIFPKRPIAVMVVSLPLMLAGSAYLAAFWNQEYGALAQPARAIRSQISPSARDQSSDEYREIERFNVEETLRLNKVFGVGFGKPFAQFQPLTDLTDFWPLQAYTPHQNILWLWLKTGLIGISVFLGLWIVSLKRCIEAIRAVPRSEAIPVAPIILASVLLMYIAYAQIDQALTSTRSVAPLAIAIALSFRLRSQPGKDIPE